MFNREIFIRRYIRIAALGGVLIVLSTSLFSIWSVRMAVLSFIELHTGQYSSRIVASDDGSSQELRIPVTQALFDQAAREEENASKDWEKVMRMQQTKKENEEKNRMFQAIYLDEWSEAVQGYLQVKEENCPLWESCKTVQAAEFVVSGAVPEKLHQYFINQKEPELVIPIGCFESRQIRFISYDNLSSKKYEFLTGESFNKLKESNVDHLVVLSFVKPQYSSEFGTESLSCATPFTDFQVR